VIVHLHGRIRLFIVGCKRESGLVGIDVVATSVLALVVARQSVVPLVVLEGPDAEEGGYAEEEAVVVRWSAYL